MSETRTSRRISSMLPWVLLLGAAAVLNLAMKEPIAPAQQSGAAKGSTDQGKLDLNTATPEAMKALGLGDNYIRRIIAGRPYTAKNQLMTRGVLPASAYDSIKEKIVAHRPH